MATNMVKNNPMIKFKITLSENSLTLKPLPTPKGFIGSHMVKHLRSEGYWVRGVDLKRPEFCASHANEFIIGDLRDARFVERCVRYAGERGNFYAMIVDKFLEPFVEFNSFYGTCLF